MLEKNKEYNFYEVIDELRKKCINYGKEILYKDDNWCVYSKEDNIHLNSRCYIDEYPEIDDNTYEERLPRFIIENELELVYRDELLQDVVVSALSRKKNVSNEELMDAVNFYDDNDSFLEF